MATMIGRAPAPTPRRRTGLRDGALVALATALVVAAMVVARGAPWTPGSDLGYGIGVAAGIALLALFGYPLRKRVAATRRMGAARAWFAAHMALGIAAPLLAILHSRMHFGSLNATVAFACMALVAASGIVGRFLYARIHVGLYGAATDASALADEVRRRVVALREGGEVDARLDDGIAAYVAAAERAGASGLKRPLRLFALGARRMLASGAARRRIKALLAEHGRSLGEDRAAVARRARRKAALVDAYLRAVQRHAQFRAFQRLFSWWHVLHVPLVWMLVATTIAHVVAVHMY
jgi:hypothetical protein